MSIWHDDDLDEYENDFIEAWSGYFGEPMYYVELKQAESNINQLYLESKKKIYDFDNKKLFHGKFLRKPESERGEIYGRENYDKAEISFITKELADLGVPIVKQSGVIEIFDREGTRKLYNIVGDYDKVQLRNRKLITRIIVSEVTERERTNIDEQAPTEGNPTGESPNGGGLTYL